MKAYWAEPASEVLKDLQTSSDGLTRAEANKRLTQHGPNVLRTHPPANLLVVFLKQFNSAVVYLLIAAALLAFLLGDRLEAAAIAAVLAINAIIGFATELRAVRSMEALRALSSRYAVVRRDGDTCSIPAEELVPGDLAILDAGDVPAADMRLVEASNLASDESSLTGESLPVAKSVDPVAQEAILAERSSMVFKGCAITRGTGEAIVTGTGMNTELGAITRLVEQSEPERSPLEQQLTRLSRDLIWLTLVLAGLVAGIGILAGRDVMLMIESGVALAVAAIPEGLPIVATLALAKGMLRMARKNALIERLSAVQTLGSTTVILTDKTGTLTENRMHVDRLFLGTGEVTFDRTDQVFNAGGQTLKPMRGTALATLLRAAALCNNATVASGDHPASGDPMEVALLEVASAGGLSRPALLAGLPEVKEVAFDVQTRMMATVHRHDGEFVVAVKGAPEAVFDCVTTVLDDAGARAFGRKQRQRWHEAAEVLAGQGLRLLAVAEKSIGRADTEPYEELMLIGLVGFQDPPRADIASAIADARRAGIRTVMVTGDHTATARHISRVVGLASEGEAGISGRDLKPVDQMTPQEREQVRQAQVFSRVTPEQKLDLIRLHQQAGDVVAMTGDGVNDAPALRKADIGIAMGVRGTQVAREAADMVLRDDAFSTIIDAIREGRIILTNIRRFTTYLLSCNLSEILIVALAVIGGLPLPLLPLQILFLNLVTDVFPALALGTVKGDDSVLERPPRPPDEPILGPRQWQTIIFDGMSIALSTLAALVMAIFMLSLEGSDVTTVTFFTLALAQLWHVFNMRNWRERFIANPVMQNAWVWLAVVVCLLILALAYLQPDLAGVLKLTRLSGDAWLIVLGCSLLPIAIRQVQALWRRLAGT